jgi:hypothetical protein
VNILRLLKTPRLLKLCALKPASWIVRMAGAVKVAVEESPSAKVNGPATTVPPSFKVQEAPFQPSPKLSVMVRVLPPGVREIVVDEA